MELPWLKLFWVDPPLMLPPLSLALIMIQLLGESGSREMTVILVDLSGLIGQPFKQERIYGGLQQS